MVSCRFGDSKFSWSLFLIFHFCLNLFGFPRFFPYLYLIFMPPQNLKWKVWLFFTCTNMFPVFLKKLCMHTFTSIKIAQQGKSIQNSNSNYWYEHSSGTLGIHISKLLYWLSAGKKGNKMTQFLLKKKKSFVMQFFFSITL